MIASRNDDRLRIGAIGRISDNVKTTHSSTGHGAQANSGPDAPLPFPVADERRATIQAANAWIASRRGDGVPDLGTLFVGTRQLGGNEFLVHFDDDAVNPAFMVCGDDIALPLGEDGATDPALRDMFREACTEAVRGGDMVFREGTAKTAPNIAVNYRCSFMPVRSDRLTGIIYIFGAYGTKALTAAERAVA